MDDGMCFENLDLIEVPLWLGRPRKGKEGEENPPTHILLEASEGAARRYKNAGMNAVRVDPSSGKITRIGNQADTDALLLSLCLFRCNGEGKIHYDEAGNPTGNVPQDELLRWKSSITRTLTDKVKEISGLREEEKANQSKVEAREGEDDEPDTPAKN